MEVLGLDIDFAEIGAHCLRLGIAFLLVLPVAWDRERSARSLGLRTFPLVSLASAGYMLIARSVMYDDLDGQARILQGLITGIGFLGGGAIVKKGLSVHGTATAAAIWATAGIGAAVAYSRYEIALVLAIANFLVLRSLRPLKDSINGEDEDDS